MKSLQKRRIKKLDEICVCISCPMNIFYSKKAKGENNPLEIYFLTTEMEKREKKKSLRRHEVHHIYMR